MRPDTLQDLFAKAISEAIAKKKLPAEKLQDFFDSIGGELPAISDDVAGLLYKSLRKSARTMLKERRAYLRVFEKRHCLLWKSALDLLESLLVVAFELGESFNGHHREQAAKEQDFRFDALTQLHARAIHVGSEVLCLLRSGFADGAHARWRTAHEIAVIATYLAANGSDLAKKYLEHEAVESCKAMNQFQEYADRIGYEPYSTQEVASLKTTVDDLCSKYGEPYRTQYGWAADSLGRNKPSFADIEAASDLEHFRPYYKMASHNVHANPKGVKFRLGLSDGAEILLAGPSNYGLVDPGHGVAISILQATVALIHTRKTIDSLVMSKIMLLFTDDIGRTFGETEAAMKEHDLAQQDGLL